jgi:hypothetical protein
MNSWKLSPLQRHHAYAAFYASANMPRSLNRTARILFMEGHQYVLYHTWLPASTMICEAQEPVDFKVTIEHCSTGGRIFTCTA